MAQGVFHGPVDKKISYVIFMNYLWNDKEKLPQIFPREIAIFNLHDKTCVSALVKVPFEINRLSTATKRKNSRWATRKHGLNWECETNEHFIGPHHLQQFIVNFVGSQSTIYAISIEATHFLANVLNQSVYCLDGGFGYSYPDKTFF